MFANTNLIAGSLGSISIGPITIDNDAVVFGLAGDSLKSLTAQVNGKKIKASKLTESNAAAVLTGLGNLGDFQIDML